MKNYPLVSVLMTAYNRESYIAESIESVLGSTYENLELIIVDDCSVDKTVDVAKSYTHVDSRVKVFINSENLGDYQNRNRAASYAKGKYIKYVDSDDLIYPHCLEVMVTALELNENAGYCLSADPDPYVSYPHMISAKKAYIEHFEGYRHFDRSPGSAMIKLEVFNDVGGFKAKKWIGDSELWLTLSQKYPLVKVQRDLVWDRTHELQERNIEFSKNNRKESNILRRNLLNKMLSDKNCPLSKREARQFLLQIRRKGKKKMFFSYFKKIVGYY